MEGEYSNLGIFLVLDSKRGKLSQYPLPYCMAIALPNLVWLLHYLNQPPPPRAPTDCN